MNPPAIIPPPTSDFILIPPETIAARQRQNARLEAIYARLPAIKCAGKCQPCCGPVAYGGQEAARINAAARPLGIDMTRQIGGADAQGNLLNTDATCPALTPAGRCAIYAARPMICRVWGLFKEMACPWGCVPDRWLSGREVKTLMGLTDDGELHGPGADFVRAMRASDDLRDKVHDSMGNPFGTPGNRDLK